MILSAKTSSLIPVLLLACAALAAADSPDSAANNTDRTGHTEHADHTEATATSATENSDAHPTTTADAHTPTAGSELPVSTDCPTSIAIADPFFSRIVSSQYVGFTSALAQYPSLSSKLASINYAFTKDLTPDNLKERYSTMQKDLYGLEANNGGKSTKPNSAGSTKPAIGLTLGTVLAYAALF
ncbi:hypothetical protein GGI12_002117 [Dipsacomyces acuminosporus]|nr:hypothetical protein GGI12_002117 [Dipsacomyces acuminosporus]